MPVPGGFGVEASHQGAPAAPAVPKAIVDDDLGYVTYE